MPRRKKKGNRNPYANKKVGKAVEYDGVSECKAKGWWARRNPDYMQTQECPIDLFVWNPEKREYWGVQAKRHKRLLINNQAKSKDEIRRILAYCNKWQLVPYLLYRDKGLHWEIIDQNLITK